MSSDSPLRYFIVDAFADRPFSGNPAAVVPLSHWPEDAWLQNVAMEMNLSETAYFVAAGGGFELRWFTPKVEVDLCGHATVAAATIIGELGLGAVGDWISFASRSGELRARLCVDRVELDFPVKRSERAESPPGLVEAIGAAPKHVERSQFDYLVELESAACVRGLTPDFRKLATVDCRGVIATARSEDERYDFVSRFFAPAAGVDEDPVCGSAHCTLADYWAQRLGKKRMVGYQASKRGGVVAVKVAGERVILGGAAVIVARGDLLV